MHGHIFLALCWRELVQAFKHFPPLILRMNFSANKPQLTSGALSGILQGKNTDRPILQVLNVKKIQSDVNSPERYRLQMSDGDKYQPCMLATQMNEKISSKEIEKFCVVRVNRYVCNTIHERKIIILIDLTVLTSAATVGNAIGHPVLLELVRTGPNASAPTTTNQGGVPFNNGRGNQVGGGPASGNQVGGGPASGKNGPTQQNNFNNRNGPYNTTPAVSSGGSNSYTNAAPPSRPGFDRNQGGKCDFGSGGVLSKQTIFPISSLSPYQNKWTIRARVSSKPSIRTWSNSRGEGRVLNVELVDESGEIRASAFNQVADKFHEVFELGKVFFVSKGRLKPANKQFNTTNNDYELSLNEDTEVELCIDAASESSLPTIQYNFRPISEIESIEPNTMIDVIGVCKSVSDMSSITTKTTNRKLNKREIHLVDRSGSVVTCTLWSTEAEEFDGSKNPVVAIKGVKVSDFGGRSLSTVMNSVLILNPDIPDAHQLRGWFDSVGKNENTQSISSQRGLGSGSMETSFLTFSQVKELGLGQGEKPDYFNTKASVTFSKKDNCLYKACPSQDCNKKVTEGSGGQFFCEKCNQNFPDFKYRMILTINAADPTGSQWLTCFQETGSEILGVSAQELGGMGEAEYDQVFQKVNFKEYIFKIRAKMDVFNDEQRLKCYCVAVSSVNYAREVRRRVEEIKKLMAQ